MSFYVVIPARYASTRLPGKPLLEIGGKPMIQWVVEACEQSRAEQVVVATDHQPIVDAVKERIAGGSKRVTALMTSAEHASGTDRAAEVAHLRRWSDDAIVVNVQGDEPTIPPVLIDQVAQLLHDDNRAALATLSTPIVSLHEFLDPNVVKVTTAADGAALYFSRAPIPWNRESARTLVDQREHPLASRHLGIYAYRVAALRQLTRLPQSSLEQIEKLEQLRALQAGMRIVVARAAATPGPGIDTPVDLERARKTILGKTI